MADPIVIVGAGQAGLQLAESLRHEKLRRPLDPAVGAESHPPYNRPPLSKQWLLERRAPATLAIRGLEAIQRRHIDLRLSTTSPPSIRAPRLVHCADGQKLAYGGLALATGARLRTLPVPGAGSAACICCARSMTREQIAAALDRCAAQEAPVVVIGGGFIGLEVAATARKLGRQVTVLEGLGRLMSRVVAPIVSEARRAGASRRTACSWCSARTSPSCAGAQARCAPCAWPTARSIRPAAWCWASGRSGRYAGEHRGTAMRARHHRR